jgi:hypothetical protein
VISLSEVHLSTPSEASQLSQETTGTGNNFGKEIPIAENVVFPFPKSGRNLGPAQLRNPEGVLV